VLLAVDLGLRGGLAEYGADGRLQRYASRHVANRTVLRRAVAEVLGRLPALRYLVLEGGGPLAEIWGAAARRRRIEVVQISAEEWRRDLLLHREQRCGRQAKLTANRLARQVIEAHGAKRPVALRHDAAEAILAGLWAVRRLGLGGPQA
jgi:hypothetical protein